MSHKEAIIKLAIATALLTAAIIVAIIPRHKDDATIQGESIPLLPANFNADDIKHIVVENTISTTTLYQDGDAWKIRELDDVTANRQEIDALVFALCSEQAVTEHIPRELQEEAGFPPHQTGASINICDGDGNSIARFILGKTIDNHAGEPVKRYLTLNDNQTATTQFLFPHAQWTPLQWMAKDIPELQHTKKITYVKINSPQWTITSSHGRNTLKDVPEGMTQDQNAVDDAVNAIRNIKLNGIFNEKTPKDQLEFQDTALFVVNRVDELIVFITLATNRKGDVAVQLAAEPPPISQKLDGELQDDEENAKRRRALQINAEKFNAKYQKWIFKTTPDVFQCLTKKHGELMKTLP